MTDTQPRREHMLEIAYGLFNSRGYHQTGIDLIMRASGVSKTTMYKHFRTKEDFILEILKRRSATLLLGMKDRMDKSVGGNPEFARHARISAILDAIEDWIASGAFSGCNFVRAALEYGASDNPIRQHAVAHKTAVKNLIATSLTELPEQERDPLAEQIMLVLEGAIVTAYVRRPPDTIRNARAIVDALLRRSYGSNSVPEGSARA